MEERSVQTPEIVGNDCTQSAEQPPVTATAKEQKAEARKKLFRLIAAVLLVAILIPIFSCLSIPFKYFSAKFLIRNECYTIAYYLLQDCGNYRDAKELLADFKIVYGSEIISNHSVTGKLVGYEVIDRNRQGAVVYWGLCNKDFEPVRYDTYNYDKYGNQIKTVSHSADGLETTYTMEYVYDSRGNVLEKVGSNGSRWVYEYDSRGNLTREIHYDPTGEILSNHGYVWDVFGNKTDSITYKADNSVRYRSEMEYTWDGLLKKMTMYTGDQYKGHIEYTYTLARELESTTEYSPAGEITNRNTYKYDIFGNKIERTTHKGSVYAYGYGLTGNILWSGTYNYEGKLRKDTEYSYDFWGNQIHEHRTDGKGNTIISISRCYDWRGNLTKETRYDENGNTYGTTEYSYDWLGDLIKMTAYDDDGNIEKSVEYDDPIITYAPGVISLD